MKIVKEPLFHFLLLGLSLFLLFHLLNPGAAPERIVIGASKIENLSEMFRRTWQRPPTLEEREGLIQEQIREEIFYREALKLNLDEDDTLVRRRLRQKMEFLTEDLNPPPEPTEAELERFLKDHPENFRSEARLSFRQVYLNPNLRGKNLESDLKSLLEKLDGDTGKAAARGDPLALPSAYTEARESEVTRDFGEGFLKGLTKARPGEWTGPVPSAYGFHGVLLQEKILSKLPPIAEVKEKVLEEWRFSKRKESLEKTFQDLRQRYDVVVEDPETPRGGAVASERSR